LEVLDDGIQVKALELLGVVERLPQGIGQRGVLVQNQKVQLVWPPVPVLFGSSRVHDRTLAGAFVSLFVHGSLRSCSAFSLFRILKIAPMLGK
jgi:hypothetical protein